MRIERARSEVKECQKLKNRLPAILEALLKSRYLSTVADLLHTLGESGWSFKSEILILS